MKVPECSGKHRIALISGGLPLGGSTTFLVNFGGELVRRNIPVQVLSFERENPLAADFHDQMVSVTCLDQRKLIFEDRLNVVYHHLRRFQPTVIVSTLGSVSFEALRYAPSGVFRVGVGQSDDPGVYKMMRGFGPWMDLVGMVSTAMVQRAKEIPEFRSIPKAHLPYGVPLCSNEQLPLRRFDQPLRILYLGRLAREQKRVHLFGEILRHFLADGLPFSWTIAGDGPERALVESDVRSAGATDRVSFLGAVKYRDVPALLRSHDIYLLASDYEGLPLSLLEAMGGGLVPVVSRLESGIPEVVDDSNGILVPVSDIAGYAKAIIRLHSRRDEFAAKSAAARARVKSEYSVAAMADRWLAALPNPAGRPIQWPDYYKSLVPLGVRYPIRFARPARLLRRLAAHICRR